MHGSGLHAYDSDCHGGQHRDEAEAADQPAEQRDDEHGVGDGYGVERAVGEC